MSPLWASSSPRLAVRYYGLLTPRQVASAGPPQVRTRCFPARPPHFPPEADPPMAEPPRLNPRLRCVVPVRRIVAGLPMRFLFVGPPVSSSLPPASRLPFQRWLRVVVLSHFHVTVLLQGTFTPFTTRPCWAHTKRRMRLRNPRRARLPHGINADVRIRKMIRKLI